MNKYIIIILTALCLCSCGRMIDYDCATILIIENNSSHTIEIKDNNVVGYPIIKPVNAVLNTGESYSVGYSEMAFVDPSSFTGYQCIVIFDNEIEISHKGTQIEHSICDYNSYTKKVSGKHDTRCEYTYIFTDEDYDRAVTMMENAD